MRNARLALLRNHCGLRRTSSACCTKKLSSTGCSAWFRRTEGPRGSLPGIAAQCVFACQKDGEFGSSRFLSLEPPHGHCLGHLHVMGVLHGASKRQGQVPKGPSGLMAPTAPRQLEKPISFAWPLICIVSGFRVQNLSDKNLALCLLQVVEGTEHQEGLSRSQQIQVAGSTQGPEVRHLLRMPLLSALNLESQHPLGRDWDIDFMSMEISPGCLHLFSDSWEVGGSISRPADSDFEPGLELARAPYTLRLQSRAHQTLDESHQLAAIDPTERATVHMRSSAADSQPGVDAAVSRTGTVPLSRASEITCKQNHMYDYFVPPVLCARVLTSLRRCAQGDLIVIADTAYGISQLFACRSRGDCLGLPCSFDCRRRARLLQAKSN